MPSYQIRAPQVPGAQPTIDRDGPFASIEEARKVARRDYGHRRDLRWSDVRIERLGGLLQEYAGPSR